MAAFAAVSAVLPSTARPHGSTLRARLRRVDFAGAATLIVSVVALLVGLDAGANRGWTHALTLSALAVSAPSFALFALIETRLATDPFAPARVVLHPPVLATYLLSLLAQGSQMAALFLVPLFFQAVVGMSASRAGAYLVPAILALVVGAVGAGRLIRRRGRYRNLMVASQASSTLAFAVIASAVAASSITTCIVGIGLTSLFSGAVFTAVVVALLAQVPDPKADAAVVLACQYLFRSLGNSVGVAASATFLQHALQSGLQTRLSSMFPHDDGSRIREISDRVRRSLDYIRELDPAVAALVRLSYRDAALAAMIPIGAMMVLGVAASLFIQNRAIKR
jgi:hypothetical protein